MAFTNVIFENLRTGQLASAPVGFSWTTLFFDVFPALFRENWKWAFIQFLLILITFGLSGLVFAFIYNKLYIKDLMASVYKAKTSMMGNNFTLINKKLGLVVPMIEGGAN